MTLSLRQNLFSADFLNAEDSSDQIAFLPCWPLKSAGFLFYGGNMRFWRFTILSFIILLISLPARAIDLTGTWTGKFNCSGFDGKKFTFTQKNQSLRISQTADRKLSVQWLDGADLAASFSGFVIENSNKPDTKGRTAIADCGTKADITTGISEIANLDASVNPRKGTGSLNGTSILTDQTVNPADPADLPAVTQCKWVFKLADTANPNVPPGCP
jgi:hypothetical protein